VTNDKLRECPQRIRTSPHIRIRLKIKRELKRQAVQPGNLNTGFIPTFKFQSGTKTKLTSAITRAVPLAATSQSTADETKRRTPHDMEQPAWLPNTSNSSSKLPACDTLQGFPVSLWYVVNPSNYRGRYIYHMP
jgi:hypothetical protein